MRSHRVMLLAVCLVVALPLALQAATMEILALSPGATAADAEVAVTARTAHGLVLECTLSGLERERLTIAGREVDQLAITDGGFRGAEGQPALPTLTRLVAIPVGATVTARTTPGEVRPLGAMTLAPVQPITDQGKAAPALDETWYGAAPPAVPSATVGEPALLHGLQVVPVVFAPVGHDPRSGEVAAAGKLTVELTFEQGAAPAVTAPRLIPESFATIYEQTVVGWTRDENVQVGPGSVIYVCPNNGTVTGIIDELAEWRRRQGYHVEVVTTATTGTTNSAIRSWLMDRYETIDPPLEFVTLVGDANGAVAIPTFNENYSGYYGEGDNDYSRLDGADVLSDVHVGRISVQTTSQLQLAVDKILDYEREPDLSDSSWFTSAGLTGDPETSGYTCIYTNQFVKQELLRLGYTRVDTIWSGNFSAQMMASINHGETVFTYRGLGGMSGMSYSHIMATTNGRRLPFACILTCDTGSFQDDTTARSEAWLRSSSGGGVGAIGTATNGTHTRYNNCMFLGIMDHLLTTGDYRFGPALSRGKMNFFINYWQNEPSKVWTWTNWNNLMGDPATEMWTAVPVLLEVEHPSALAVTAMALPVTVTNHGAPVAGARVAAYQDGTVRSWAQTDASGRAVLDIDGTVAGDLSVTVTGHDLYPYQGTTSVGMVARSVDLAGHALDGDGQANPGETVQLSLQLRNGGTASATNVTARLVAGPAWADLPAGSVSFGTIGAGSSAWGAEPWTVTLAAEAPGGGEGVLEIEVASGAETWTSLLTLPVVGPRGDIAVTTWGTPGGSPDPGEAGSLSLVLSNVGDLATAGATGTLSCSSRWVDVTDQAGAWGAAAPGSHAAQTDAFSVAVDADCFPGQLASFTLDVTYAEGGTQTLEFQATLGAAGAGDPTGPDAYGYWAFSSDDEHELAPTYDWVEITSVGTNTGINDTSRWDDEVKVMDLPFPFTYYGRTYERITICSNGWLSFGATDLKFYRNWILPADGSPDAMVCAFWDDLAEGQIYTWHDETNHRFIVQWDQFGTYYDSYPQGYHSGNCTFEIILHDPAYGSADTGDGRITMQYQALTIHGDETTYFTTGLQNETRDVGLTYAYGNNYAGGAATLTPGRAITFQPVSSVPLGTVAGTVTNASGGGSPIPGAVVRAVGSTYSFGSDEDGSYTGSLPAGTWDLAVLHPSCDPDTVRGVSVTADEITPVNFSLTDIGGPDIDGTTRLVSTTDEVGPYVVEAVITDLTEVAEYHLYYTSSTHGGPFAVELALVDAGAGLVRGEIPGQPQGTRVQYWLTASDVLGHVSTAPAGAPWPCYTFQIGEVSDILVEDFENGFGDWQYNANGNDSASSGIWILANPVGTESDGQQCQPEDDHTTSPGVNCWFTGQHVSGQSAGYNDVDGGATTLTSPLFDLAQHGAITMSYWRWYTNDLGGSPGEDTWLVEVSNDDGQTWSTVEETNQSNNTWQQVNFDLADHYAVPDRVRLRFSASDFGEGSLVEAAVDDLRLSATALAPDEDTPTVTVTGPDGGETYLDGLDLTATWQAGDDVGVVEARLYLSLDGGQTWGAPLLAGPHDGTATWTVDVPGGGSSQARIRVEVLDSEGRSASDISDADFTITADPLDAPPPAVLALAQNRPNPFNPRTEIRYELPRAQDVTLRVYDVQGRLVRTLVAGEQPVGVHTVAWQGLDDAGQTVASGMYFYRLTTAEGSLVRKMLLLK